MKIGVMRFPNTKDKGKPIFNLTRIISNFASTLYVITGNKSLNYIWDSKNVEINESNHYGANNPILRIISFILTQFRLASGIFKRKDIDTYILLGGSLIVPLIIGKLFRKKLIIHTVGPTYRWKYKKRFFLKFQKFFQRVEFALSDGIIFYSPRLVDEYTKDKYKNKIEFAHEHIIDLKVYNIKKPFEERDNIVGYIGRFYHQKNIMNFIKSIPVILRKNQKIKFLIGGGGKLEGEMINYIEKKDLQNKVKYVGWISHDNIQDYLNELKLLVIPSYSEGLPNILLEAMACGTPVLVSDVGAVGDIIKDGENGYLLDDKSPEAIATRVIETLNDPKIQNIGFDAHETIRKKFKFENTMKKYEKALKEIGVN